jgi:hypothetical protein
MHQPLVLRFDRRELPSLQCRVVRVGILKSHFLLRPSIRTTGHSRRIVFRVIPVFRLISRWLISFFNSALTVLCKAGFKTFILSLSHS